MEAFVVSTTLTIVSAGAVAKNQMPLAETELKKAPTLDALFITYLKKETGGRTLRSFMARELVVDDGVTNPDKAGCYNFSTETASVVENDRE